ncbi:MAG: MerR family transcriptional regulator [bacterium TMED46]|nr:MAG: MerR family transcriptional regulator [bacterium TMED46]|tara:strand:- start:49 stop:408 length:360 start_codon:yes stop_codon:yes gene_type:complete
MSKISPKVKKLYYSIGEVSELTGLKAYVLRYWETEFSQLKPSKNRAGNRTYRQKDIDLIMHVKNLLYNEKYTIDGARSVLKGKTNKGNIIQTETINEKQKLIVKKIRENLETILSIISK